MPDLPLCTLDWQARTLAEWNAYLNKIPKTTLLQHYPYAQAIRATQYMGARHAVIFIDGQFAGLLQTQEIGLFNRAVHVVAIDRGPLWVHGFGSHAHWHSFLETLNAAYPRGWFKRRRLIVEWAYSPEAEGILAETGWRKDTRFKEYQTLWLDITPTIDVIKANLRSNWRGSLNKAERTSIRIDCPSDPASLTFFYRMYMEDRARRRYRGPSVPLLKALRQFMPRKDTLLLSAHAEDGTPAIAAILVLRHGLSATYQIGWTTQTGRALGAHHRLLWEAIIRLKAMGVEHFDLGGVNDTEADSLKTFKEGLGGQLVTLAGLYR